MTETTTETSKEEVVFLIIWNMAWGFFGIGNGDGEDVVIRITDAVEWRSSNL